MKEQDQIKVLAELDDPQHKWEITHFQSLDVLVGYRYPAGTGWIFSKPYLTSRDAVTPVIEKRDYPLTTCNHCCSVLA